VLKFRIVVARATAYAHIYTDTYELYNVSESHLNSLSNKLSVYIYSRLVVKLLLGQTLLIQKEYIFPRKACLETDATCLAVTYGPTEKSGNRAALGGNLFLRLVSRRGVKAASVAD